MRVVRSNWGARFARPATLLGVALFAVIAVPQVASAQSLTPMRGKVTSFADQFAVRVWPGNPYKHRIKIEVHVYDQDFKRVPARVIPAQSFVAPESSRSVMVMVPFEGQKQRKVRICAESVPFTNTKNRMRTQVCGKFLAQNLK